MTKKKQRRLRAGHKARRKTVVTLIKSVEGRPNAQKGVQYSVRREATDRFKFSVIGREIQQIEIQPDDSVGLVKAEGDICISADNYRRMLNLRLPGDRVAHRQGRLPDPPRISLITTAVAANILDVSPDVIRRWLHDGTLTPASTYENEYGTTCFLLSESVIRSPATRAVLAEKIAAYQKRRDAGKQAVKTRLTQQRKQHDEYMETITQAAPTDDLRQLLTAAYLLWHLNHRAKQEISTARTRLYAMKDRMLGVLYGHYAGAERTVINVERAEDLRASFALSNEDLAAGGLVVYLQHTGLGAGELPQPCFLLHQVRPESVRGYGDARHYVSIAIRWDGYRFPFHSPVDNASQWLPAEVCQEIAASERAWAENGQEFTFGGRPATWVEARAIPQREIEDGLAAIYLALAGKGKSEFTALPPRPARSPRAYRGRGYGYDREA